MEALIHQVAANQFRKTTFRTPAAVPSIIMTTPMQYRSQHAHCLASGHTRAQRVPPTNQRTTQTAARAMHWRVHLCLATRHWLPIGNYYSPGTDRPTGGFLSFPSGAVQFPSILSSRRKFDSRTSTSSCLAIAVVIFRLAVMQIFPRLLQLLYSSTSIRRPFDCLAEVIKVKVTLHINGRWTASLNRSHWPIY